MFVKSEKNTVLAICTIMAIALLIALMTYMSISDSQEKARQKHLCENVSPTGTVTEKYITEWRGGTFFHVVAEHTYIAQDGSEAIQFTGDGYIWALTETDTLSLIVQNV